MGKLKQKSEKQMPAHNKRFGASGGVARPKVCGDFQHLCPSEWQ
jgi:hypothetical protein